jgi:hypothetical protein
MQLSFGAFLVEQLAISELNFGWMQWQGVSIY